MALGALIVSVPMTMHALTVQITPDTSSGINNATYTATLEDGTILGFANRYGYEDIYSISLVGAKTAGENLIVPDSVEYQGTWAPIYYIGLEGDEKLHFPESSSLRDITVPMSVAYINMSSIPFSITTLHFIESSIPGYDGYPSLNYYGYDCRHYFRYTATESVIDRMRNQGIDVAEGIPELLALNITVSAPGTLANEIITHTTQWNAIGELIIKGPINSDDMELLNRMPNLYKLDLAATDIKTIGSLAERYFLTDIIYPEGIEAIEPSGFKRCIRLKEISLKSVKSVGEEAFVECYSLERAELPNVSEMGSHVFSRCNSLESITCSKSLTYIPYGTFYECTSLKSVVLPDEITSIQEYSFSQCKALSDFQFPAKLERIGNNAFSGSGLTKVVLPEGVKIIESEAFSFTPVTSVDLPSTLMSIYGSCFYNSPLTDVCCRSAVPPVGNYTFDGSSVSNATLHVPAFSMTAYLVHENWYQFGTVVPLDDYEVDNLTIRDAFTLSSTEGLADKANLNLTYDFDNVYDYNRYGHLTIDAATPVALGKIAIDGICHTNYSNTTTLIANSAAQTDAAELRLEMEPNRWTFFNVPFEVKMSDIVAPDGFFWVIRRYSGSDRAAMTGNTWHDVPADGVLRSGEGYILHTMSNGEHNYYYRPTFIFPSAEAKKSGNTLLSDGDVELPLEEYPAEYAHNRSWNLVGNPYPAFFDTRFMQFTAPLTVWNGYSYNAVSPVDDSYILRPYEAFFVQRMENSESLPFLADGRQHDNSVREIPAARAALSSLREVFNFIIDGNGYSDRTRLVVNPDAAVGYEMGCDATKFMSDTQGVPQIYMSEGDVRMAINERPASDDLTYYMGASFSADGRYMLSLDTKAEAQVTITDLLTGASANLSEGSFSFTAVKGDNPRRFAVKVAPMPSGIHTITADTLVEGGAVYTIDGRHVMDAAGADDVRSLPAGIYVVSTPSGAVKVSVK